MSKKTDKRKRLIEAAKELIYQQGFYAMTLADIAIEADVPLGNIYYYFKTKADIGAAVLNLIAAEQQIFFGNLNKESSPRTRLHYFLEQAKQDRTSIMLRGCRVGRLCQEFAQGNGMLYKLAANIMMNTLLWVEAQFYTLGFIEEASNLSLHVIYGLQGAFLLSYALKDANLIIRQVNLLQDFIQERISEKTNEALEVV